MELSLWTPENTSTSRSIMTCARESQKQNNLFPHLNGYTWTLFHRLANAASMLWHTRDTSHSKPSGVNHGRNFSVVNFVLDLFGRPVYEARETNLTLWWRSCTKRWSLDFSALSRQMGEASSRLCVMETSGTETWRLTTIRTIWYSLIHALCMHTTNVSLSRCLEAPSETLLSGRNNTVDLSLWRAPRYFLNKSHVDEYKK